MCEISIQCGTLNVRVALLTSHNFPYIADRAMDPGVRTAMDILPYALLGSGLFIALAGAASVVIVLSYLAVRYHQREKKIRKIKVKPASDHSASMESLHI